MVDALPSMRSSTAAMLLPNVSGVAPTSPAQQRNFTHGGKAADSTVSIDGFSTNKVPGFAATAFFWNSALVREMTVRLRRRASRSSAA